MFVQRNPEKSHLSSVMEAFREHWGALEGEASRAGHVTPPRPVEAAFDSAHFLFSVDSGAESEHSLGSPAEGAL